MPTPTLCIENPPPYGRQGVVGCFFDGRSPAEVMAFLPWTRRQVLRMDLRCRWNIRSARG